MRGTISTSCKYTLFLYHTYALMCNSTKVCKCWKSEIKIMKVLSSASMRKKHFMFVVYHLSENLSSSRDEWCSSSENGLEFYFCPIPWDVPSDDFYFVQDNLSQDCLNLHVSVHFTQCSAHNAVTVCWDLFLPVRQHTNLQTKAYILIFWKDYRNISFCTLKFSWRTEIKLFF